MWETFAEAAFGGNAPDHDKTLLRYMRRIEYENVKIDRDDRARSIEKINRIVDDILRYISMHSPLFSGARGVICVGSSYQGFKVGDADEFDYIIPLSLRSRCEMKDSSWTLGMFGFNDRYKNQELTLATVPDDCKVVARGVPYLSPMVDSVKDFSRGAESGKAFMRMLERGQGPQGGSEVSTPQTASGWFGAIVGAFAEMQLGDKRLNQSGNQAEATGGDSLGYHSYHTDGESFGYHGYHAGGDSEDDEAETVQKQPRDLGPGYRWVTMDTDPTGDMDRTERVRMGDYGELIPFLIRKSLHELLNNAFRDLGLSGQGVRRKKRNNWPALTLEIPALWGSRGGGVISVDFTPCIPHRNLSPPPEISLPRPGKSWPGPDVLADIMNNHPPALVAMRPFHWQISYADCEKQLSDAGLDRDGGCRKSAHRVMKHINKTVWCPTTKPAISSYMLKNLLFWECEDYPKPGDWAQDNLWIRIRSMSERLLRFLDQGNLPQFFNPSVNLADNRDQQELRIAREKLRKFLKNPLESVEKHYIF